eukprot:Nk52_evm10s162 gene=Nk52_evmTU10s162
MDKHEKSVYDNVSVNVGSRGGEKMDNMNEAKKNMESLQFDSQLALDCEYSAELKDKENLPEHKMTIWLLISAFASMIGGIIPAGYHMAVVNNAKESIRADFLASHGIYLDTLWWSIIVSAFCVGGLFGGLLAKNVTNKFGRKRTILFSSVLFVGGALLQGFATELWMLVVGRFLVGLPSGLNTVALPMYLNEIAPLRYRGMFGVFTQLGVVSGILIADVIAMKSVLGAEDNWQWSMFFSAGFPILCMLVLPFCPKSPVHAVSKNDSHSAKVALLKFRSHDVLAEKELVEMEKIHRESEHVRAMGVREILADKGLRKAFLLANFMNCMQQFSGVDSVMFYSTQIFKDAQLGDNSEVATVLVGTVFLVFTVVSLFIIERTGRRPLLVYGFLFQGLFALLLCVFLNFKSYLWANYCSVGTVLMYVVMYAIGPGPIPYLIASEMMPKSVRDTAQAYALFTNWFSYFIVGLVYPYIQTGMGDFNFVPFGSMCLLAAFVGYEMMPETKGKTSAEVIEEMQSNKYSLRIPFAKKL